MTERILDLGDLCGRPATKSQPERPGLLPYSRQHIWRLVKAGTFPAPLQLSKRRVGWLESEVLQWIRERPRVVYSDSAGEHRDRERVAS